MLCGRPPLRSRLLAVEMLIVMVLSDFHVIEHAERIFRHHDGRAIKRDQVRCDRLTADTHETNGKAHPLLTGETWLVEADDPLARFAGPHQDDAGLASFGAEL